jgi:hypothetical protein
MKKKLNVDAILNELRGNSAFFPDYRPGEKQPPRAEKAESYVSRPQRQEEPAPQGVPPPVPRPGPRTVPLVRKVKREIKQRQPFDVYWDQYLTLKKISDAEEDFINGRGMSQMVREALDEYFKANNIPLEKHPK